LSFEFEFEVGRSGFRPRIGGGGRTEGKRLAGLAMPSSREEESGNLLVFAAVVAVVGFWCFEIRVGKPS
jgi:hypothetical protein